MKAELFSSDFVVSFLLFVSVLVIITFYYQNLQSDVLDTDTRNDMYARAINIGSLLATTSGYPHYWDNTNVKIIGFYDDGKFNLTKFEFLKNYTPYTTAKIMLGTGAYEFNITLYNVTGNIIEDPITKYNYTYGKNFANAEQIVIIKRLGMINLEGNATKTILEVALWV